MISKRLTHDPRTGDAVAEAFTVLPNGDLVTVSRVIPYIELQHDMDKNVAKHSTACHQRLQGYLDAYRTGG